MRKIHIPGVRRKATRLVIDAGRSAEAIAHELTINSILLGRWGSAEHEYNGECPTEECDADDRAESSRFRKEFGELIMLNPVEEAIDTSVDNSLTESFTAALKRALH